MSLSAELNAIIDAFEHDKTAAKAMDAVIDAFSRHLTQTALDHGRRKAAGSGAATTLEECQ